MSTLRELQTLLFGLITAPEGVAQALSDRRLDAHHVETFVDGDERLSAAGRLDLYANMYFYRVLEVLRSDYPKVVAAVGDLEFHNLATDYLWACPSSHPSLRNVGARLPAFLKERVPEWLADLARLERVRLEVFDGPDAPLLTIEAIRALPPDSFGPLSLRLAPSVFQLRTGYAVDQLWQGAGSEPAIAEPLQQPRSLVVWREGIVVYHRALEPLEAELIDQLSVGTTFGVVCDLVCAASDDPARAAFELLYRWVSDGLIRDLNQDYIS